MFRRSSLSDFRCYHRTFWYDRLKEMPLTLAGSFGFWVARECRAVGCQGVVNGSECLGTCASDNLAREPGSRTVHGPLLRGPEAGSQGLVPSGSGRGSHTVQTKALFTVLVTRYGPPATDGGADGVQQQNFPVSHYKLDPTKSRSQRLTYSSPGCNHKISTGHFSSVIRRLATRN